MEIQQKPDYFIFAEDAKTGEMTDFPNIKRGWGVTLEQTQGKPPLEWFNSAFNRIDKNALYLLQQGVPEWSADVLYPIGAIIKVSGNLYKAKRQNTNLSPDNSPNDWELFIEDGSLTKKGIVKLSSAVNSTAENQAATPKAVKTAYDLASEAYPKSGGTLNGDLTATNITANTSLTVGSAKATYSATGLNFDKPLLINGASVLKVGDYNIGNTSTTLTTFTSLSQLSGMACGEYKLGTNESANIFPNNNYNYVYKFGARNRDGGGAFLLKSYNSDTLHVGYNLTSTSNVIWREIITTANVSSYQGLGYGQTWQDLTSSRKVNVAYTNDTGKPIMLSILISKTGIANSYFTVDGVSLLVSGNLSDNAERPFSLIIPVGSTYMATESFRSWNELR